MMQDDSTNLFSTGLWFYWYKYLPGEERRWYWGQLVGSTHRLGFIRDELERVTRVSDIDLALARLSYQMENYLIRVYELRERAAKLLLAFAGRQVETKLFTEIKGKKTRQHAVKELCTIDQQVRDTYLRLLDVIDDDIDLRNQNTHDTFLCLGLSNGHNMSDPHDALLDAQHQHPHMYEGFKRKLRSEIREAVRRYDERIREVNRLVREMLQQMDFLPGQHHGL